MSPDQKLLGFETLMGEVSAALADLVDVMKTRADGTSDDEIAASLAELVGLMEKRKSIDLADLVKAVKELRLNAPVTVNVQPTPLQVNVQAPEVKVEIMPAPPQGDSVWEVRIAGHYGAPDRVMTIRKKPVKEN